MTLGHETKENTMKSITCFYTPQQLKFLAVLVEEGYFCNRSEALRHALQGIIQDFSFVWAASQRKDFLIEVKNNG